MLIAGLITGIFFVTAD